MERGRRDKVGLGLLQITTSGKILSSRCLGNEKVLDALTCILLSLIDRNIRKRYQQFAQHATTTES